jgi:hypothetical protein
MAREPVPEMSTVREMSTAPEFRVAVAGLGAPHRPLMTSARAPPGFRRAAVPRGAAPGCVVARARSPRHGRVWCAPPRWRRAAPRARRY